MADPHDAAVKSGGVRAGNPMLKTDLKFVRIEPYVVPKRSLTGESTESRGHASAPGDVQFQRKELPVYVGQQMDVFIEATPVVEARR